MAEIEPTLYVQEEERQKLLDEVEKTKIDREIVFNCQCGGQRWNIVVNKPNSEKITGFRCVLCDEMMGSVMTMEKTNPTTTKRSEERQKT